MGLHKQDFFCGHAPLKPANLAIFGEAYEGISTFFLVCGATYHLPSVEITVDGFSVIPSKMSRERDLDHDRGEASLRSCYIIMFLIISHAMPAFMVRHWP